MLNIANLNQSGNNGERINSSFYQRIGTDSKLSSHSISVPSGTTNGDITLYCISIAGFGAAEINNPAGLTLLKHRTNDGSGRSYSWYSRTASSEPANYTFTTTITTHATITAVTYRGPTTATAGDLNLTFPSGTQIQADSMSTSAGVLVCYFGLYKSSTASADYTLSTEPTGLTQIDVTGVAHTPLTSYEKLDQNSASTDNYIADYDDGNNPVGLQIMLT